MNEHYFTGKHLPMRFLYALVFAFMFSVIGWAIPNIYYQYVDGTVYYTVEQPISVDKTVYKPCKETILITKRNALIDTIAVFSTDLTLVGEDGSEFKVPDGHLNTEASVRKGEVVVKVAYKLPCELADGRYFWQSTMNYSVRGVQKIYTYITEVFEVSQDGELLGEGFGKTSAPVRQNGDSPDPLPQENPSSESQPRNTQTTTVVNPQPESNPPAPEPTPTPQP